MLSSLLKKSVMKKVRLVLFLVIILFVAKMMKSITLKIYELSTADYEVICENYKYSFLTHKIKAIR